MYLSFSELKKLATDHKEKLLRILWHCLKYVDNHPESKKEIGVFWFDEQNIMMNTKIFASFMHRKANTVNRNLRSHKFHYQKTRFEMRQSLNEELPDSKHWILRYCDEFTRSTTEEEAISNKYIVDYTQKSKNACTNAKKDENDQIYDLFDESIDSIEPPIDIFEKSDILSFQYEDDFECLFTDNDDIYRNEENDLNQQLNILNYKPSI